MLLGGVPFFWQWGKKCVNSPHAGVESGRFYGGGGMRIRRTPDAEAFTRRMFRFRKAGSSKLSVPCVLAAAGTAPDTPSMAGRRLLGTSLSPNPEQ